MFRGFQKNLDNDNMDIWHVGDDAKLCRKGECFWVIIEEIKEDKVKVLVNNHVVMQKTFHYGDVFWTNKRFLLPGGPLGFD